LNKTIKVEDQVYDKLEQIRGKRETFSEVVGRLLDIYDKLGMISTLVEGQGAYQEWKHGPEKIRDLQVR